MTEPLDRFLSAAEKRRRDFENDPDNQEQKFSYVEAVIRSRYPDMSDEEVAEWVSIS